MTTDYSNYRLSAKEKTNFLGVGFIAAFTVLYLFYHSIAFSLAGGLVPYCFLSQYSRHLAAKRRALLTTQFKDFLYSMSASAAVNLRISDALKNGLEHLRLLYDEDTPLIGELEYMIKGISENRESDLRLLADLARRSGCGDIDDFVQVYTICRTMGGDLEKVLKNTIEILVDKMNIEREIKTLTAQKKLEGKMISAVPLVILLFLNLFSSDYLMPLYTTGTGRFIMTAALAGIAAAFYMTEKLTAIDV